MSLASVRPLRKQRASNAKFLENALPCSTATLNLAAGDLARSGLTPDDAKHDGIFAVDSAQSICPDFAAAPALVIPYYDSMGCAVTYERGGHAVPFCRVRYLTPPGFPLPRGRRYDQPGDSGTPPYFPQSFDWRGDTDGCVLVEGEKKAIALCRAGIPAVAIGGVFNFAEGSAPLHSTLADMATKCADVYIVFDSDAATKPQVRLAEWRLATQMALPGARVHTVRLPPDGDDKVGADDYLVKHGAKALQELILSTPALGEQQQSTPGDEITVSDMLGREVTPVEELIPGWLEKGIPTFLAGVGGVHKSRLALQWALCLNAGAQLWGVGEGLKGLRDAKPTATMVYCAAEDDANELARRAQAITRTLKLSKPKQGVFWPCKDAALVIMHESAEVELRPFYHRLVRRLQAIKGHKVVVLDSAYDFVRFAGRAKIDEDAVNYFIKVILQGICDQTDSTLLIPWHPSQAGSGRDSMDGWSVAWHNAARARLALSEVKDADDTYELRAVKRNHGPKGQPLRIRFHNGALLPNDLLPGEEKTAAVRKACVDAALYANSMGLPLTRQKKPTQAIIDKISKMAGVPLSGPRIKEELEEAVYEGKLKYQPGYGRTKAGYCAPPQAVETGVETALKPDVETR
jgi:hypothetical protein